MRDYFKKAESREAISAMHVNFGHMVASSVVHGLVYGAIFKVFRELPLAVDLVITAIGIFLVWRFSRNRG